MPRRAVVVAGKREPSETKRSVTLGHAFVTPKALTPLSLYSGSRVLLKVAPPSCSSCKMADSETLYLPLPPPKELGIETPPVELTEIQADMQRKVQAHFAIDGYTIPGLTEKAELMEVEKFWLSYECMLRYVHK